MPQSIRAFTQSFSAISLILTTPVLIYKAFNPKKVKELPPHKQYRAVWDTGATHCAISKKVIDVLLLQPSSVTNVQSIDGYFEKSVYLINIMLPNEFGIPFIEATEAKFHEEEKEDIIIGMDVIRRGDFVVTNKNNKTVFSFRTPSVECIDFVKQIEKIKYSGTRPNAPCPCNSGKRFKDCHGKAPKK